jgi:hypothetical protein
MESINAEQTMRLRAVILEQVYINHQKQLSHLDLIRLGGSLERIGWDVSLNDLLTVCQDLQERGYLIFDSDRNKWTGRRNLVRIAITPKGRNIVEGAERDPGVLVIE